MNARDIVRSIIRVERRIELNDGGAIVHKRLVTPFFCKKLKPVFFRRETGVFNSVACASRALLIPIREFVIVDATPCTFDDATHEGHNWLIGNAADADFYFLVSQHPAHLRRIKK